MKTLLSRYWPGYPAALIYMLQKSEYNLREYFEWLGRVRDFTQVQNRQRLVYTSKAKILVIAAWALVLALVTAGWIWQGLVGGLLAIVIAPWLLPFLIVVPLALGQLLIQKPRERAIDRYTHTYLSKVKAKKIAIAGSYGKTTFKEILATVLSEGLKTAATPGNYNTPIGISRFIASLEGDEQVLIFELGEYYRGDIKRLAELVEPTFGVITGVNEAHLSKFKTLENTHATIFELADFLQDQNVYVNGESPLAKPRTGHIVYSEAGAGEWKVEKGTVKSDLTGTSFTLTKGDRRLKLRSQLLGRHQVGPLSVAVAIAAELGLTDQQITQGVASTHPFKHRMQPRPQDGHVVWIDDTYNGNPDGARAGIAFLKSLEGHRRIYVTPGLVETGPRAEAVHAEIGRQLAVSVDEVILIRNSVTGFIQKGLEEAGFKGELRWYDSGPEALAALPTITKGGDVVLLQNDWGDSYV